MKHEELIKRLEVSCLGLDAVDPLRLLVGDVVAALREPEQEPFGIWHQGATDEESDFYLYSESGDVSCPTCIKLYTTPPQRTWVGLTDEEFWELDKEDLSLRQFVQAIDDRLKEKNT